MKLNLTSKLQQKLIDNAFKAVKKQNLNGHKNFGLVFGKNYVKHIKKVYINGK